MIDLDELARAATKLEPLPASSTKLAALVCEGTPELGQVVEIVRFDEALTASLLQSANSSWSASRSEITTVRDAVIRLGASPVLALTLGMTVKRQLLDSLPQYGLGEGELWRHSVAASLAAELLTQRAPNRPPAETATAALLHDLGKLVMARFLDPVLLGRLHAVQEAGASRLDAEGQVLGIDHAELGGLIARSWALPDSLVRGIRLHGCTRPIAGRGTDQLGKPSDTLVAAVHLADAIAKAIGAGVDDNPNPATIASAMVELGLTSAEYHEIRILVEQRLSEVESRFE